MKHLLLKLPLLPLSKHRLLKLLPLTLPLRLLKLLPPKHQPLTLLLLQRRSKHRPMAKSRPLAGFSFGWLKTHPPLGSHKSIQSNPAC